MRNTIKCILLIFILWEPKIGLAQQPFILSNEKIIFSFQTTNGKTMALCSEKNNKYLVYRFGKSNIIEFEYPIQKDTKSWKNFKFSTYLRGGGIQNEGMDLNYVTFVNKGFKYIIYSTYFSNGDKYDIGIRILNLTTKKETNIKGITKSQKGTLTSLRENNLIAEDEELYD